MLDALGGRESSGTCGRPDRTAPTTPSRQLRLELGHLGPLQPPASRDDLASGSVAFSRDQRSLAALRTMLDRAHLATPGQLPEVVLAAARELDWTAVIYLIDYEQRLLLPVPAPDHQTDQPQPVDTTLAGRCFRNVKPVRWSSWEQAQGVWLPVLDGSDRLGVLKVTLSEDVDLDDPVFRDRSRLLAHLAGHLIAAKSPYGDGLTRVQRLRPRSVASELLWQLLPPLTFACEGLVVSGLLQPAYDVAADAFDYSVLDDVAHLAVLDATGHDLGGTLLAAVALAAYRNSRREGRGLYDTVAVMDRYIAEQGRQEKFATGILSELDLSTGRLRYLNAGHPAPLLMRAGKVVKELTGGRRVLLGLGTGEAQVAEEWLEPEDRIVFYTDGVTEARRPDGSFFGLARLTDQLRRDSPPQRPCATSPTTS